MASYFSSLDEISRTLVILKQNLFLHLPLENYLTNDESNCDFPACWEIALHGFKPLSPPQIPQNLLNEIQQIKIFNGSITQYA